MSLSEFLQSLPYFSDLDPETVDRICRVSPEHRLEPGDVLVEQGSPGEAMYLVIEGGFEVVRLEGGERTVLGHVDPGEVIGEMAMLEDAQHGATVVAEAPSRVIEIGRGTFDDLMARSGTAVAMLHTVLARLRASEAAIREHARLAALGTLAAGLMHEVNNPTAAARNAVRKVAALLDERRRLEAELAADGIAAPDPSSTPAGSGTPGALERADRIDEIESWMSAHGAPDESELVAALVDGGWDVDALDRLTEGVDPRAAGALARWVAIDAALAALIDEAGLSLRRISELVDSMRTYSRVGSAGVERFDVHRGLRDTQVILRHVLEGIEVEERFDDDVPEIEAYGAELNQVWTNLLGNAADAMDGDGRIVLSTRAEPDAIVVEVSDDGPGIPPDVRPRIFDAFFTTKDVGQGTGLGLHIAREVVRRHGGEISVDSQPGETTFTVRLPVTIPDRGD